MKFKTILNAHEFPKSESAEAISSRPSLTVPDQTMSIKEIVERFTRGLPISAKTRVPIYDGEEDAIPDARSLDLSEIQELAEEAKERIDKFRSDALQREQNTHKKKLEQEWKSEFLKSQGSVHVDDDKTKPDTPKTK